MTFEQALSQLRALSNPNIEQLRAIVSQIDVSLPVGARTTLLYSGDVGSNISANQVAQAMVRANSAFGIINDIDAAKFLINPEFDAALRSALGNPTQGSLDAVLYGSNSGFWSNASQRLAQNASGAVVTLSTSVAASRIFGAVELPALLKNANVTTIDGIPRTELKRAFDIFRVVDSESVALSRVLDIAAARAEYRKLHAGTKYLL